MDVYCKRSGVGNDAFQGERGEGMTLQEQILLVAEARRKVAGYKTARDTLYHEWMHEQRDSLADLDHAELDCKAAEDALRSMTLVAYQETGNKAPAPGVGIREGFRLVYTEDDAKAWAVERKAVELLKIDVTAFRKQAELSKPGFAMWEKTITAIIATDLDAVIAKLQVKGEQNESHT